MFFPSGTDIQDGLDEFLFIHSDPRSSSKSRYMCIAGGALKYSPRVRSPLALGAIGSMFESVVLALIAL